MKWLKGIIPIFFILALLAQSGIAWALAYGNRVAFNNEYHTAWGNNQWNGTYGRTYIQSSQTIANAHLNSIYIRDYTWGNGDQFWYEGGWIWLAGEIKPRNFAAWTENWVYNDTLRLGYNLGQPNPGMSHTFHVFLETRVNPWVIQWYFDGNKWLTGDRTAQTSQGIAAAASERQTSGDNNWAHWMSLQRADGPLNWAPWANLSEWTYRVNPLDPTYYIRKISNAEFYVQQ